MGDLIDRQAAIDEVQYEIEMINNALDSLTLDYNTRERLCQRKVEAREILNFIKTLPTIHPEPPKRGKWLYRIGRDGDGWICSECGERTVSAVMGKPRYIYCPICGAKMEGNDGND